MLLLVGLGNPGRQYEDNRHNVGFMALDMLAKRYHFTDARQRFRSLVMEGSIGGEKLLALKPHTFMNHSGVAVAEAANFFKIPLNNVIVFYDELDLPPGKLRVKTGGGANGHNGIKSIDSHLGIAYRRVRIGIGHPGDKDRVHAHVLSDFTSEDWPPTVKLLDAMCEAAPLLAKGDDASFMNRVTLTLNPPPPKPEKKVIEENET